MKNENPLISVIVPIYNVENDLPTCIDSILNQTYKNMEIILVDDGSNDICAKLCDSYANSDPRIEVFHKKNGGLSDARNYGIERVKGEYLTFIDSDDYVDLDYVEYLIYLLQKYNSKMSICQHRVYKGNKIKKDYGKHGKECILPKECIERMLYHDVIDTSAWAKLYHKSLFTEIKYPKGKLFEDIATTYALMLQCDNIAVGYESKYNYIYRKESIVNCDYNSKKLDLLEMTDKMADDILGIYPELKKAVIRRQVYARFSTLNQMIYTESCKQERDLIINFIKKNSTMVFFNSKTPIRDKFAIFLLNINYTLYKFVFCALKRL